MNNFLKSMPLFRQAAQDLDKFDAAKKHLTDDELKNAISCLEVILEYCENRKGYELVSRDVRRDLNSLAGIRDARGW